MGFNIIIILTQKFALCSSSVIVPSEFILCYSRNVISISAENLSSGLERTIKKFKTANTNKHIPGTKNTINKLAGSFLIKKPST